jgi:hypothetical protein
VSICLRRGCLRSQGRGVPQLQASSFSSRQTTDVYRITTVCQMAKRELLDGQYDDPSLSRV